ncbi:hypothetical protein [Lactobacillus helveticus]|uniref:hypothetical protein n=1 Tax=Lactobacillus helveticus TaxID=1587 RepID=UPI003D81220A
MRGRNLNLIIMLYPLHHVEDVKATLRNASSMLEKDGEILIQVPGTGEFVFRRLYIVKDKSSACDMNPTFGTYHRQSFFELIKELIIFCNY